MLIIKKKESGKYGTNYKDFKDYMNYSRKSEVYFKCLSCHRCEKKCP